MEIYYWIATYGAIGFVYGLISVWRKWYLIKHESGSVVFNAVILVAITMVTATLLWLPVVLAPLFRSKK